MIGTTTVTVTMIVVVIIIILATAGMTDLSLYKDMFGTIQC